MFDKGDIIIKFSHYEDVINFRAKYKMHVYHVVEGIKGDGYWRGIPGNSEFAWNYGKQFFKDGLNVILHIEKDFDLVS